MKDTDLFKRLMKKSERPSSTFPRIVKFKDYTVGKVNDDMSVDFKFGELMPVMFLFLVNEEEGWTSVEFEDFLIDRLPSSSRRDIEHILRRAGLVEYSVFKLAEKTRAFNPKDLVWLAYNEEEKFDTVLKGVFEDIFIKKQDFEGHSVNSPSGQNIKRYGVSSRQYGIYKKRLYPYSSDVECEVAVYNLAKKLGVDCCPAWFERTKGETLVFSKFEYDFLQEYVVHVRHIMEPEDFTDSLYKDLIKVLPEFKDEISKMVLLDFVTRQTDRHLSNFALKVSEKDVSFYPLYDNGRSLFFEDKEELMQNAVEDIELYSTEFGTVGTYYDAVLEINEMYDISKLINLDITFGDIVDCYRDAKLPDDRFYYATKWTWNCLKWIKGGCKNEQRT